MRRSVRSNAPFSSVLVILLVARALSGCGQDAAPSAENGEHSAIAPLRVPVPPRSPGVPSEGEQRGVYGGVVAVSEPIPARIGAEVLRSGGNAIDAAAAVQFALNVVEPQFSGIGGGGFMMVHLARGNRTVIIDCRERAPGAATPEMFDGMSYELASTSGLAVGVPGTLLGVATALQAWGTRSLAEALRPAIALAAEGFVVSQTLAGDIARSPRLDNYEEARNTFKPGGVPLSVGDRLVQSNLAHTFRLIAERGVDVFYRGEIAEAIVAAQRQTRPSLPAGVGRMELSDLASYAVALRDPVEGRYRGFTIKSMSPPSSGGLTLIQMLKMLERFPLADAREGFGFGSAKTLHVMAEAMRLAYQDRALWMGDADFAKVPAVGLLADPYVATRASLIQPETRITIAQPGDPRAFDPSFAASPPPAAAPPEGPEGQHTTHFSIVDRWGNVVSYTSTIEDIWGSGIMVPGHGFLLNNELTDFNFTPRANPDPEQFDPGANDVAPFKRPRSSMSPTIVFRGARPLVAYGSPGGSTIINTVLNITLNLIDHGMSIQQAIDAPRMSRTSTSDAGALSWESGFAEEALQGLRALGHVVPSTPTTLGSVQAVVIDLHSGRFYGGADARRAGTVEPVKLCEIAFARPRPLLDLLCRYFDW